MSFLNTPILRFGSNPVALAALAVVLLLAGPMVERLVGLTALDAAAQGYAESMAERTWKLFLAAKTMNAALSVVENAGMSLGAIASVTVLPGKVLEPVDDLVEQFSLALLAATGASYLLKSLAALGGAGWLLRFVAPAGLALLAAWRLAARRPQAGPATGALLASGRMLVVAAFVLRLGLPAAIALTAAASDAAFGDDRRQAETVIGTVADQLGTLRAEVERLGTTPAPAVPADGLLDWMRDKAMGTSQAMERLYTVLRQAVQTTGENFDKLFAAVGTLMAIWVGEVLLFLGLVLLGWKAVATSLRPASSR